MALSWGRGGGGGRVRADSAVAWAGTRAVGRPGVIGWPDKRNEQNISRDYRMIKNCHPVTTTLGGECAG